MNLTSYTKDAIRTESLIPVVATDIPRLTTLLALMVAAGNLIDVIKKDAFYGLPSDPTKLQARTQRIARNEIAILQSAAFFADPLPTDDETIDHIDPRLIHAILGVSTESVEMIEPLLKSILSGQPMDSVNLQEEGADTCWYLAILYSALGASWDESLERNIAKLRARYPEKFNGEDARNRDLAKERDILEGKAE